MAEHFLYPGVQVNVLVGVPPQPAKVYKCPPDENQDQSRIIYYMECTTGLHFEIEMAVSKDAHLVYDALDFSVVIGGIEVDGAIKRRNTKHVSRDIWKADGLHGYVFEALPTPLEEARRYLSKSVAAGLGKIEVTVNQFRNTPNSKQEHVVDTSGALDTIDVVSEKDLKGRSLSHFVNTEPQSMTSGQPLFSSVSGESFGPEVRYEFRFAAKERLQALQVIPTPLQHLHPEHITLEQIAKLQQNYRRLLESKHSVG